VCERYALVLRPLYAVRGARDHLMLGTQCTASETPIKNIDGLKTAACSSSSHGVNKYCGFPDTLQKQTEKSIIESSVAQTSALSVSTAMPINLLGKALVLKDHAPESRSDAHWPGRPMTESSLVIRAYVDVHIVACILELE